MSDTPVILEYEGDGAFRAPGNWARRCDKQYVVHERYHMVAEEERSKASHDQQFASIGESFKTLPDHLALTWANADDLRKHALIMTGWHIERRQACSSPAEARKIAAFVMQIATEYTLASVAGNVVVVRTARSQKTRGPNRMNKTEFQKSKQDVLDWIDDLLGVEPQKPLPATRPTKQIESAPLAPADDPAVHAHQAERV